MKTFDLVVKIPVSVLRGLLDGEKIRLTIEASQAVPMPPRTRKATRSSGGE